VLIAAKIKAILQNANRNGHAGISFYFLLLNQTFAWQILPAISHFLLNKQGRKIYLNLQKSGILNDAGFKKGK
jgi:hypothetical protein